MSTAPKFLNEKETLEAVDRAKVRQALRKAFEGLSNGNTVQPNQTLTLFPNDEGDCIFYPGVIYDLDLVGVKVSPYINALKRDGKYPVTAFTLLLSASTGLPLLLCDSYALTTSRTAATTALALEYLTPPSAKKLCVIGSGGVGLEHLRYLSEQHDWSEVTIWSPSLMTDPVKAKQVLDDAMNASANSRIGTSAEDSVRDADVVMLCTSSGAPVIQHEWLKSDVVVSSISTNVHQAHEIEPDTLSRYAVFCDYKETAPDTAGEMIIAAENGTWKKEDVKGDLSDLVIGKAKAPTGGQVFFRSTGLGIEDLAIASLLI